MGERMTVGQEQHARMLAERWAAVPWDVTAANKWLRAANDAHEWPEDPREDESRAMVAEYIEEFIDVDCDELTGMLMDALRLATRDRARLLAELDAVREDRDTLASALAEIRESYGASDGGDPRHHCDAVRLDRAISALPADLAAERDARVRAEGNEAGQRNSDLRDEAEQQRDQYRRERDAAIARADAAETELAEVCAFHEKIEAAARKSHDVTESERDTLAAALAEHRRTVAEVLAEPHAYIGARERAVLDALAASPVDLAAQRDARMQERGAWWALARHCHEASIAWTEQQAKAVCAEGRKRDALDDEAEKGGA